MLFFAIIEFGWAIYGYNTIQSAANEGVRRAIVLGRPSSNFAPSNTGNANGTHALQGTPCNPFGTVMQAVACAAINLPQNRITVIITAPTSSDSCPDNPPAGGQLCFPTNVNIGQGTDVSVELTYAYSPLIGYGFNFFPPTTMRAHATSQFQ